MGLVQMRFGVGRGGGARRLTVVLAAVAMLATGCGGGSGGEADGDVDKLTVWIMEGTNPDASAYYEELKTAFQKETGVELEVQEVPWADAYDKFQTAIAGGTGPDVAEVGTTWTPEFAEAGALVDLTDRVQEAGLESDLVPGLVEAGTVDDKLYGMPWYAGVRSVIYRTDVFEKAGVEPPTSWDEIVTVGAKIKQSNPGMTVFPIPGDSEYGLDPFIWGAGGEIAVEDGDSWKAAVDSPEAQEGIGFYTGLATEHDFSTPAAATWDEADLSDAFTKGNVAMMISGSWTPDALVEANPELKGKIGAFPIPGKESGMSPSFLGGSHLGVFTTTSDEELSWTLVEMMTTGELAKKWGEQSGFFPGTTSLLAEVEQADDPLVSPFAQQMAEAGKSVPVTPLYGKIQGQKTMASMMGKILSGKASVAEASSDAAGEMNEVFSE